MIIVFLCDINDTRLRRNQIESAMPGECDVKLLAAPANFVADPYEHLDDKAHVYVAAVRNKATRPYTLQDIAGSMEPILSADFVFAFDWYEEEPYDPFFGGMSSLNGMRCLKNRAEAVDNKVVKGFDMRPFLAAARKKFKLQLVNGPTGSYHTIVAE